MMRSSKNFIREFLHFFLHFFVARFLCCLTLFSESVVKIFCEMIVNREEKQKRQNREEQGCQKRTHLVELHAHCHVDDQNDDGSEDENSPI